MWWDIDTEEISQRIRQKISRRELLAVVVILEVVGFFFYIGKFNDANVGGDYIIYLYREV